MSEQNKIDEIKEEMIHVTEGPWVCDGLGVILRESDGEMIADVFDKEDAEFLAKAPEYITYLLQEIERLQGEVQFWKEAAENQQQNNFRFMAEIERKDEALKWYGDFGNWYVKDGSWPALEDKGNRARLAYKGEGDASG